MIVNKLRAWLRPLRIAFAKNSDGFLRDVSGVVHVGANAGQERYIYDDYGLNVLWVEPIPEVFTQLKANIRNLKNQLAVQALVTDLDDKEYVFHIANNNGASSSILDLKHHRDIWPSVDYTTTVKLKSTTLPSLLEREGIDVSGYDALIMDTQGSELLVLRGSVPVLRHFKFIKTEVPDFESYEGCCQLSDMDSFLSEHGFKEFSRRKFASRAEGGSYFDVIYKRQS